MIVYFYLTVYLILLLKLNTWLVFRPFLQEVSANVLLVKANEFRPTVLIMLQKLATFILLFFLIKDIQGGLHFRDLKASDVSTYLSVLKKNFNPIAFICAFYGFPNGNAK